MKTTDTWRLAQNVQALAYILLKRAVIALGGKYVFPYDKGRPLIPANLDDGIAGPRDYEISRLVVDENGLSIYGFECGDYPTTDEEVEISSHEIYVGWMQYIFDYLPDVEGVDATATDEELSKIFEW